MLTDWKTENVHDKRKLTKMYHLYAFDTDKTAADTIITEDSNSGAEMMQQIFHCNIVPAHGNSIIQND